MTLAKVSKMPTRPVGADGMRISPVSVVGVEEFLQAMQGRYDISDPRQRKALLDEMAAQGWRTSNRDVRARTNMILDGIAARERKNTVVTSTLSPNGAALEDAPQVQIFVDDRGRVAVVTAVTALDDLWPVLAEATGHAVYSSNAPVDALAQLLEASFQIGLKLAGYKAERVSEQRVLLYGEVWPGSGQLLATERGETVGR